MSIFDEPSIEEKERLYRGEALAYIQSLAPTKSVTDTNVVPAEVLEDIVVTLARKLHARDEAEGVKSEAVGDRRVEYVDFSSSRYAGLREIVYSKLIRTGALERRIDIC